MNNKTKLTMRTGARTKAYAEMRAWAVAEADRWGWDTTLAVVIDAMGSTRPHDEAERVILRYARGVGWPAVLREIAQWMEDAEIYLDAYPNWREHASEDKDDEAEPDPPPVPAEVSR